MLKSNSHKCTTNKAQYNFFVYLLQGFNLELTDIIGHAPMLLLDADCFTIYRLLVFGYLCAGITACVTLPASALFSVTWFPVSQRATATSTVSCSTFIGFTIAYLAGMFYIDLRLGFLVNIYLASTLDTDA